MRKFSKEIFKRQHFHDNPIALFSFISSLGDKFNAFIWAKRSRNKICYNEAYKETVPNYFLMIGRLFLTVDLYQ